MKLKTVKLKAPNKSFADRRFAQKKELKSRINYDGEYITGVALIREGVTYSTAHTAHWELRAHVFGIDSPCVHKGLMTDDTGFRTNLREFVGRAEAADIGRKSGQVLSRCVELLSYDVAFWPHPTEMKK